MRDAFADELLALAAADPRLVLLSGDIGNRMFDRFKAAHGPRFLNCGVAEANMTSLAAGLALGGLRPITYTIAPFGTVRCLEQIRVDLCGHHLPVIVVGTGAGLSYAELGATHHSLDDIGLLRMLPGMTVLCPGDALEMRAALRAAVRHDGPCYLRLGKKGEPLVHTEVPELAIGQALPVRDGEQVALISCGTMLPVVIAAAERLATVGVSAAVVSMVTVKPLDELWLAQAAARYPVLCTVEEHSRLNGLGGAVADWLSDRPDSRCRLVRVAAPDRFIHETVKQAAARQRLGLTAEGIAETVQQALGQGRPS